MPLPMAPPMIRPSARVARRVRDRAIQTASTITATALIADQRDLGELVVVLEPAKTDPDIPGQHQVEKRRHPDHATMGEVEHVQQPEL